MHTLVYAIATFFPIVHAVEKTLVNSTSGIWDTGCTMMHSVLSGYTVLDEVGKDCSGLLAPRATSCSGGYCLASLSSAGWYRSASLNPVTGALIDITSDSKRAPYAMASNSGGSMFTTRLLAFGKTADAWTFPCYLLTQAYKVTCYFHGSFGQITEECSVDHWNLASTATGMVYGPVISAYGGPFGAASSYASVYSLFLSDLPVTEGKENFMTFSSTFLPFNTFTGLQAAWILAYTLVSPKQAEQDPFNFGFDSYLPRAMNTGYMTDDWYKNTTIYSATAVSANTPSGIVMVPFSNGGKSWDTHTSSPLAAPLKIFAVMLSYMMVQKLTSEYQIIARTDISKCEDGCPVMDGAFSDNLPLSQQLSYGSHGPEKFYPREIMISGPASTFDSISYLSGLGSNKLYTAAGLNLCPFTQPAICKTITTARRLTVGILPPTMAEEYMSISGAYEQYNGRAQIIYTFCGDPLMFDHFQAQCQSDGICHMAVTVKPGAFAEIAFMPSKWIFVLSLLFIANSPVSKRFVEGNIPNTMRQVPYYVNMDDWFPDFVATAPQKGGIAFTKPAGHALLDFLTYLVVRVSFSQIMNTIRAGKLQKGGTPSCGYGVYQKIISATQALG